MPNFIWTANDKFGKPVVREIAAETIEESKAMLLDEGCTNLTLKTDEILDAVSAAFPDKMRVLGEDVEVKIPPEERIKNLEGLSQTILGQIFERIVQDKLLYILAIILLVSAIFQGQMLFALLIGIGIIGWFVFRCLMALPEIYYVKLNHAKDWHKWTEVLRLVEHAKWIRQHHFIKLPEWELVKFRAQALTGLGMLSDALKEFNSYENQPGLPSWMYKVFVAELYDLDKQYDKAVEYLSKAIEEKPTTALYLDLLFHLLHYKKDRAKAREVFTVIEKSTRPDMAEPFYIRCRGILSYLETDYDSARYDFEYSLDIFEKKKGWPFRDGNINLNRGYLCCIHAKQGDLTKAKNYFDQAEEYLSKTERTKLLQECRNLMGE